MIPFKIVSTLLLCFSIPILLAQKKVILENLRCHSLSGPVMLYLQNSEIKKTVASDLNHTLLQNQQLSLFDTSSLNVEMLNSAGEANKPLPGFTETDTTKLHLYINLFENNPLDFFTNLENSPPDATLFHRAKSIFTLEVWLFKSDKQNYFHEILNIIINASENPGMGIPYGSIFQYGDATQNYQLSLTPKGFTEMLKLATNLLFNPRNELAMVEMKAAPVYFADNYFQPKTFSQPKIYVTTSKQVSSFSYLNQNELIRLDEVVYEEIKIKGKKAEKYPEELTAAIKNTNNYSYSDYVFLLQEARDVIRNKNYRLKLTTQLDPKMAEFQSSKLLFTHFLPGNFHYLFFEKDTLAIFSISRNIVSNRININYDRISNGYDSTGIFSFNSGSKNVQISHAYIVTGKIGQNKFQVRCSDFHNTIKEIYLNEKLICIAQGKFSPEKFVIFDASLSAELLIQLFIIGFNTFFET